MKKLSFIFIILAACISLYSPPSVIAASVDPSHYASRVISYTPGSNAVSGYTNPGSALGEPARNIDEWGTNTDVTMFYPAWKPDQLVSIGAGGELILGFNKRIMNNPDNPYGVDFIIFGNAFFTNSSGKAGGIFAEPATISISQDGTTWYDISSVTADNLFPTQGYTDSSGTYVHDGSVPADFLKPVDPSIKWKNKTYTELLGLYKGSGGGTGVDMDETGLDWIQYIKLWQAEDDDWSAEIDAVSAISVADPASVPVPGTIWLLGLGTAAVFAIKRKKM